MKKTLTTKIAFLLLLSLSASADEFINIGYTANQLHVVGDQAITISSGIDQGEALRRPGQITQIDLKNFTVKAQTRFPLEWNLYRAAIEEDLLWVSDWANNRLYRLSFDRDLSKQFVSPRAAYRTTDGKRGMETVLRVNGQTWVAYSNPRPDWSGFEPGQIVVLDETAGQTREVKTLTTGVPNPKNMILAGDRVFVAVGEYGKPEGGAVLAVDPVRAMQSAAPSVLGRNSSAIHQSVDMPGVPGAMFFDSRRNELYACDLEYGNGQVRRGRQFFRWNLQRGEVETFSGKFNSCGSILVDDELVYVLNLNGGGQGSEEQHLYLYDRSTGRELCARTITPGQVSQSVEFFPNEMKLYQKGSKKELLVTVSGFAQGTTIFPALLVRLPLDELGRPTACE